MDVAELCDRQEIIDLITKYTRAVDTSQWDNLYDVFTDGAVLDYTSAGGAATGLAEAIPFIRNIEIFTSWQHTIGQIEITFADAARTEASVVAYMINPLITTGPDGKQSLMEVGGYYRHQVVRTDNGWRSRHMVDELVWSR